MYMRQRIGQVYHPDTAADDRPQEGCGFDAGQIASSGIFPANQLCQGLLNTAAPAASRPQERSDTAQ